SERSLAIGSAIWPSRPNTSASSDRSSWSSNTSRSFSATVFTADQSSASSPARNRLLRESRSNPSGTLGGSFILLTEFIFGLLQRSRILNQNRREVAMLSQRELQRAMLAWNVSYPHTTCAARAPRSLQ